ncbi:MAG: DUF1854 domain-containing protein [Eubacteriales bacterium]
MKEPRESIALTADNATFSPSRHGLLSLDVCLPDGTVQSYERVVAVRAFPLTSPESYIVIREPSTSANKEGQEIGTVEHLVDLPEPQAALLRKELERRYFTPEIIRIHSMRQRRGVLYIEADTEAGTVSIVVPEVVINMNVRLLEDGRILITDTDGNVFVVTHPERLDKTSQRKLGSFV